jgi:hypothetical protein
LTIDKDSTGRLWATWQQGNKIYLNVTGTDGNTWGTPFQHPDGAVSLDDNSALIAFGPGKMGLLWSSQPGNSTDGFYWSVHTDGDPSTTWSAKKAITSGLKSGDDHMNLKWLDSSGGRVFAAVKTSFTTSTQPLIELLAMDNTGAWTQHTIAKVSECPNRVTLLIDEATQRLRTFATYPKPAGTTNAGVCTTSGGAIYEKSTPLNNINFTTDKTAHIVDADQYVHNVSSTKQNLNKPGSGTANSGLMVIADVNATSRYWYHYQSGSTAQAAPATIYIYKVYYNPPGSDTGSNSSLNAEYVVIRNGDDVSHSISGWTVRDAAGHVYKFGTLRLGAGKQAIIHTGKGTSYTTSASTHLYWGRSRYVWNNTGDKVILRRADGSLKDTCTYPGEGASKYYCYSAPGT